MMHRTLSIYLDIAFCGCYASAKRAYFSAQILTMITSGQMRAARALLGIDQRELAKRSGLSLPTVQRMEASGGVVRGNVDSLMKLIDALLVNGIELIGEGASSTSGGRGVRLK